jgi:hypothetical protein
LQQHHPEDLAASENELLVNKNIQQQEHILGLLLLVFIWYLLCVLELVVVEDKLVALVELVVVEH